MGQLDRLAAMCSKVLAAEGQSVTVYFVDKTSSTYDPETGVNTPIVPTAVVTDAIFLDFALVSNGQMTYAGTLIEKEDKEVYLSSKVIFPRVPSSAGDYIVDKHGVKWRIMVVKQNNPSADKEIMFKLLARK